VAFDVSEAGLFELDREMRGRFPDVAFYAELGSIQNAARVKQLLRKHRTEIVYHAAAYKHVPMLEGQPVEAVRNNAIATWDLACLAREQGVARFVSISTDKAVRARNVLGLTKRVAEAAVESIARTGAAYFAVRLGNVLGSSGSVSRIFQRQIEHGKPLTLTDARMTRYLTTMDEATRFVLDASAIGTGGEIYSLDMGDPVRIEDLARRMIAVNGTDAAIVITGKRPGEELSEQLFQAGEVPLATVHPRIQRMDRSAQAMPFERMKPLMQSMREACETGRADRLREMMDEICFAGAAS
jgi:FlaA1/EpsC-like NDP-sugar epimerase